MMICCCSQNLRDAFQACLRDYDKLLYVAVILIYIQIGCAITGSLGALYNGVLLANLGIALFALVAIESGSQSLGRAYAVLLFCAILLDISWFILFSHDIWNISKETDGGEEGESRGMLFIFSVRLTLAMEMVGFFVRLWSSLLWIQIYRLGVSNEVPFMILLITILSLKIVSNVIEILLRVIIMVLVKVDLLQVPKLLC
ncbi:hypothetical protein E1A91_A08G019900v1 [Gossypium mustelinum]|uniref:Uncharacterized protein n=2 Tax=Gossypium TaxID=3633 RepID=A0A5J5UJS7_GOSBA|nr:hypothetical protein ES319_A08G018000v1 [Gossypium barbadense]KAB2068247.1 hypothetical protein ES319_A08G018000v1 [Gossypium barbadense]TYJ20778.1 hypothetical protein E1A91_A08G019900v1 [Gossypium mustelinum]TYJ20779.1 hypothetical protein E1A91_A08G019900v1 [Gossypium mustelinum]